MRSPGRGRPAGEGSRVRHVFREARGRGRGFVTHPGGSRHRSWGGRTYVTSPRARVHTSPLSVTKMPGTSHFRPPEGPRPGPRSQLATHVVADCERASWRDPRGMRKTGGSVTFPESSSRGLTSVTDASLPRDAPVRLPWAPLTLRRHAPSTLPTRPGPLVAATACPGRHERAGSLGRPFPASRPPASPPGPRPSSCSLCAS